MKKVAFRTLGCKVNHYESEAMEELFLRRGYARAEDPSECDVYIVNTCTVTHASDSKCRQQINRIKRKNPKAVVGVVGCYAQVSPEDIKALDNVDIIMGTKGRGNIVDHVETFMKNGMRIVDIADLEKDRTFDELSIERELDTTRAYVKIQEGCDMFCTYCIIPYARGHISSRDLPSILEEVRTLTEKGYREIVLTGIHVASYGRDTASGLDLVDVCEAVAKIAGVNRLRLSSMEPRFVTEERLLRLSAIPAFCDHFHLSLQSGSDAVLKRMNRRYDRSEYAKKIALIRKIFPNCGITTDVIVGFPGETKEDFEDTMAFCKELHFSRIHIFPYSKRQGTPAAEYDDQVDEMVKKERAKKLSALEEKLRLAFMDSFSGKMMEVLFEAYSADPDWMYGYTKNYIRIKAKRDDALFNEIREVRLLHSEGDLMALEGKE